MLLKMCACSCINNPSRPWSSSQLLAMSTITPSLAGVGTESIPNVNSLLKNMGQLEVRGSRAGESDGSDVDYESSDESHDSDSTRETFAGPRQLLRARSPISKGGTYEITWEVADMMLYHHWYFLAYDQSNSLAMYCWAMRYTPSAEVESQIWHVNLDNYTGFCFRLCYGVRHSPRESETFLMGHVLVLASHDSGRRALYRLPEFTKAEVYNNINNAYGALLVAVGRAYGSPTTNQNFSVLPAPVSTVNPADLHFNPTHPYQVPTEADYPSSNQENVASGMVVALGQDESHQAQAIPPTPVASDPVLDMVEMKMDVDDNVPTKEEIEAFVRDFRSQNQNANVAICMHCQPGKNNQLKDLRPTSLARHLKADFGVKTYYCDKCEPRRRFTTKDQLEKHTTNRHEPKPDRSDPNSRNNQAGRSGIA
ncbi:unnamed protein product [Rhizoctonia solani]|uniref:C2H2-type domain-containing protein n=1 Tax=Rhizoctonia solani TaxID=456999 RepID=A0A8H3A3J3_9AGAM|nr:unnamed protein product [Rhizoctonia solani]